MFSFTPILYLVVIIASFFIWKKYSDKRFFWFFLIAIAALCIFAWNHLANNIFHFSGLLHRVNFIVVISSKITLLVLVIFVTIKKQIR